MYLEEKKSVREIASILQCSENKINYWFKKFNIGKRSISEAVYLKNNPTGDPFLFKEPVDNKEIFLYGLGVGLYWGEGTKSNKYSVRLGNTDPRLIKNFILFLQKIFNVPHEKLRFGLQIFSDMSPSMALRFWQTELNAQRSQFQKVIITPARSIGTYRQKTKHGVLTIYFSNKKLRDLLCEMVEKI